MLGCDIAEGGKEGREGAGQSSAGEGGEGVGLLIFHKRGIIH